LSVSGRAAGEKSNTTDNKQYTGNLTGNRLYSGVLYTGEHHQANQLFVLIHLLFSDIIEVDNNTERRKNNQSTTTSLKWRSTYTNIKHKT